MNTENKEELPVQSLRFNAAVSNGKLYELMRGAEILRIERGAWQCFVEFRSGEDAVVLERSIESWYENWRESEWERQRLDGEAKYAATADKMWKDVPGIPVLLTRRGKPTLKGLYFIDDNGKFQYVWPED